MNILNPCNTNTVCIIDDFILIIALIMDSYIDAELVGMNGPVSLYPHPLNVMVCLLYDNYDYGCPCH